MSDHTLGMVFFNAFCVMSAISVTCKNSHGTRLKIIHKRRKIMKANAKKILGIVVVILLLAALGVCYFLFREKPVEGSKTITIEVVNSLAESTVYDLKTDAEYLRQAMEEADGLTFVGVESQYGLNISEVNGEVADFNTNGAYWGFYVNGEYCNYGVDTQPVNDGDAFKIEYTPAA